MSYTIRVNNVTFKVTRPQSNAWNTYVEANYVQDTMTDTAKKHIKTMLTKVSGLKEACIAAGIPVDPSAAPPGNSASVFVKDEPDLGSQLADGKRVLLKLQSLMGNNDGNDDGNDNGIDPEAQGLAGLSSAGHTPTGSKNVPSFYEFSTDDALAVQADALAVQAGASAVQADASAAGAAGAAGGQAGTSAVQAGTSAVQADALVAGAAGAASVQAPATSGNGEGIAKTESKTMSEKIADLESQLEESRRINGRIFTINQETMVSMDKLRKEKVELQKTLFNVKYEKETLTTETMTLKSIIERKDKRITELGAERSQKDERIQKLQQENIEMNRKHSEQVTRLVEEKASLRGKIDNIRHSQTTDETLKKHMEELKKAHMQLQSLTSQAKDQDSLVLKLEQEKHDLTVTNKTLEARITELTTVNEALKARISGHVTEKQALEARVTELTQEMDHLNSEALQGGEQNYLLRIQIGQLNTQISALTKERDDLQAALKAARETNNFGDISGQLTIGFQRVEDTLTKQHGFVKQQLNNIVGMQSDVLAPGIRDQSILVQDFVKAVAGTAEELARGQAHMISQLDDIKLSTGTKSRFQQLETSSVCVRTLAVDHKTETSARSFDPSLFTDPFSSRTRTAASSVAPSVALSVASSVSSFGHSDRRLVSRREKDEYYRKDTEAVKQRQKDMWKNW